MLVNFGGSLGWDPGPEMRSLHRGLCCPSAPG